jgi:ABC-2 type transport system ATP-binding protein
MAAAPIVELDEVTKRFGRQLAVDRLSLTIPRGSIYGFIGPNGSGKTTTMRMILRIYQPESGRVTVLGRDEGETADDRLGYLPEERGLYPRMTVRRVLRYLARLKGVRDPRPRVDAWLARLGADQWADKRVDQLSKGMAQKVQFVAAVVADPELVILDEPFSGLDPVNLDLLRGAVRELRDRGTTVILSTHDMQIAQDLCDAVLMIYRGQKVLDGPLEEIRRSHAETRLRVRLADDRPLPAELPGVTRIDRRPIGYDLTLADPRARRQFLQRLLDEVDVEHFEFVQPTLHDIFVSIAGPEAVSNPTTMASQNGNAVGSAVAGS